MALPFICYNTQPLRRPCRAQEHWPCLISDTTVPAPSTSRRAPCSTRHPHTKMHGDAIRHASVGGGVHRLEFRARLYMWRCQTKFRMRQICGSLSVRHDIGSIQDRPRGHPQCPFKRRCRSWKSVRTSYPRNLIFASRISQYTYLQRIRTARSGRRW